MHLFSVTPSLRGRLAMVSGVAALALPVTGCQNKPVPGTPVYAIDFSGGAKSCTVSKVEIAAGKPASATMSVGNDGGWCAVTVAQANGKPFAAGLMQARPGHGRVLIHSVGDNTRVDYTPDPGFAGTDSFAVSLLPGAQSLSVDVTVTK